MRSAGSWFVITIALPLATVACGPQDDGSPPARPAYCNPLSSDHCLLPWPSSFFLRTDSTTKTGFRVHYPIEALPRNVNEISLDPTRFNVLDGFSIGSQILVHFKDGVGVAGLPGQADLAQSVSDQSLVQLWDMIARTRVPLFAEVDANARTEEVAALIIRPQVPLEFDRRYAVVLRPGLYDARGGLLAAPEPFRLLRDGVPPQDPTLAAEAGRVGEVLDFLEGQQIARSSVILAWDFRTASHEATAGNLLQMVDDALNRLPSSGPSFKVTQAIDKPVSDEPHLLRQVEGTMEVPSYLAGDGADSWLRLDGAGRPVYRGPQSFPFVVAIPRCAESAKGLLPILVFGHGLFTSAREIFSDYNKMLQDRLCMVTVATNWIGLSDVDLAAISYQVLLDFSNLPRITDRLQQSHVNIHALVKLVQGGLLQSSALQVNGKPVSDGRQIYYLGISDGGIQGTAFAAMSRDIERFILNVAGGWWSMMIQRSSNFRPLAVLQERVYPQALDRLILVSLSQHLWDYTDPITFARHPLRDPLSGREKKRVLLQEAVDDDQVPHLATRAVVRALGLQALDPLVEEVYGVSTASPPLDSAYAQWDLHVPEKPPTTNIPASKPKEEDSSHKQLRLQESCMKQMEAFLRPGGQVVSTCNGPCDPE